jgi:hypothetical protein
VCNFWHVLRDLAATFCLPGAVHFQRSSKPERDIFYYGGGVHIAQK